MSSIISVIEPLPSRVYCVGDIHGCPEELEVLIRYFEAKETLSASDDVVVFVGDYIDRGPNSRKVVELLISFKERFPKTRFLKGNHEDMMLGYLGLGGFAGHMYLFNGGVHFLRSYNLSSIDPPEELMKQIPSTHMEFFDNLEHGVLVGNYLIVHAGIDPQLPLHEQTPRELLWIREEFIEAEHDLEKTIIFGHTVYPEVLFHLPYKIGIDTGLVYGNRLTTVELNSKRILEVERGSAFVLESPWPV